MAAGKEPVEVQGDDSKTHEAQPWTSPAEDHRSSQPGDPRLGELLPRGRAQRAGEAGRLGAHALAQHPAPACGQSRPWTWIRSPPLPKCLADCPRADLSEPDHPWRSRESCPMKRVNASCRKSQLVSRMRENRPSGSEGGVAQTNAPSPPPF